MIPPLIFQTISTREARRLDRLYKRDERYRAKIDSINNANLVKKNLPRHKRAVIEFSKVHYSKNQNFAIVQELDCADCCFGATYLLRRQNDKWTIIDIDLIWAS